MDEETQKEIRQVLISLLARREYSQAEIRLKYRGRYSSSELNEVMEWLVENGLQSDQRYAGMLVRHITAKGQGYLKLKQKAKEKGIDEALIRCALEEEQVDWYAVAVQAYKRKYSDLPDQLDRKEKDRRVRFMLGRGFSYDQVKYAFDAAADQLS